MSSLKHDLQVSAYKDLAKEISLVDAMLSVKEKIFTKKDLGISYRELNHWSTNELLFESNEEGKWRRFNIVELIWIEIVKELRAFNFSLATIKNIRFGLSQQNLNDLLKEVDIEQMEEDIRKSFPPDLVEKILNSTHFQDLKNNNFVPLPINNALPGSAFEMLIMEAYYLKFQIRMLINAEGFVTFTNELYQAEITSQDMYKEHFERSHISISINSLIAKLFFGYSNESLHLDWKLISEEENKILDLLKSQKNLKSVNIKFNKDSQLDLLEYTEELRISPQDYLKKVMVTGGYQEIVIKTQNGNVVVCERTIKQKFK